MSKQVDSAEHDSLNEDSSSLAPSSLDPSSLDPIKKSAFEVAAQQRAPGVIVEFMDFLFHNKKWWLTPIILVLLLFSVFIALTSSALAPFIYVLF